MTHRRAKGERSRRRLRSREAPRRSRSREASIAISRSTASIAITRSIDRNLANRRSQSREAPCRSQPLVEPSCLSLFLLLSIWPDLMIFFSEFCLCFCIKEWMILYICLATEKMWPDLTIFFLGFVCVSILRNEWYYIFVWQPRKCEKMWATNRKCVFYGIFKNTTKH